MDARTQPYVPFRVKSERTEDSKLKNPLKNYSSFVHTNSFLFIGMPRSRQ